MVLVGRMSLYSHSQSRLMIGLGWSILLISKVILFKNIFRLKEAIDDQNFFCQIVPALLVYLILETRLKICCDCLTLSNLAIWSAIRAWFCLIFQFFTKISIIIFFLNYQIPLHLPFFHPLPLFHHPLPSLAIQAAAKALARGGPSGRTTPFCQRCGDGSRPIGGPGHVMSCPRPSKCRQ